MVKAKLYLGKGPIKADDDYSEESKAEIEGCNKEVRQKFYDALIELPALPVLGTGIELADFFEEVGISDRTRACLETENTDVAVTRVTIRKGYVDIETYD